MASAEGGVEIEEVARQNPGAIHRVSADPLLGLLGLPGPGARPWRSACATRLLNPFVAIAQGLVRDDDGQRRGPRRGQPAGDRRRDARPTAPRSQRLVCLDAKITLDDSGLARHPDLEALRDLDEEDPADAEARQLGINFIHLDGTIGCMVNGAGLAMTTMDLVKHYGGEPANFLDVGGGARRETVSRRRCELILADPKVKAILVNIFGGITRGDEVAARPHRGPRRSRRARCRWSSGSSAPTPRRRRGCSRRPGSRPRDLARRGGREGRGAARREVAR